jgi:hypothetical protein
MLLKKKNYLQDDFFLFFVRTFEYLFLFYTSQQLTYFDVQLILMSKNMEDENIEMQ